MGSKSGRWILAAGFALGVALGGTARADDFDRSASLPPGLELLAHKPLSMPARSSS